MRRPFRASSRFALAARSRGGLVPVLAMVAVAACSLPSRDNAFDSANAPTARLQVVDAITAGVCPLEAEPGHPVFEVGSRGRCIALDASASSDPNGDALLFSYAAYLGSNLVLTLAVDSTARVLVLTGQQRLQLPVERITFEVSVSDDASGTALSSARSTFTLLNDPPVALTPPPRRLPSGGYPWAPGVPMSFTFEPGESFDPDSDPRVACWSIDGSEETCDTAEPTILVSPSDSQVVATLRLQETNASETLSSDRSLSIVSVRPPDRWIAPDALQLVATRLDTHPVAIDVGGTDPVVDAIGTIDRSAGKAALAIGFTDGNNYSIRFHGIPDGEYLTELSGSSIDVPASFSTDGARRRVWYGTYDYLQSVLLSADGTTATPEFMVQASTGALFDEISVDTAGRAWAVQRQREYLYSVSADGIESSPVSFGDEIVTGIDSRPGTDETWIVLSDKSGLTPSRLVRFRDPAAPDGDILLDTIAAEIHWVDPDRFWLMTAEDGLVLVDVRALETGRTVSDAAIFRVPGLWTTDLADAPNTPPRRVFADKITGELWYSGLLQSLRISPRGVVTILGGAGAFDLAAIDASGIPWYANGRYVRRSLLTGGVDPRHVPFTVPSAVVDTDNATGGLLQLSALPRRLLRVSEDGLLVKTFDDFVDAAGETVEIPPYSKVRVAPDGRSAWAVRTEGGLDFLDMPTLTATPVLTAVLDSAGFAEYVITGNRQILEPLAPVGGAPPSAWLRRADGTFVIVHPDGTVDDIATIPSSFITSVARSLGSNELCIATSETGVATFRRLLPDGTVDLLGSSSDGFPVEFLVASSGSAGNELCWFAAPQFIAAVSKVRTRIQVYKGTSLLQTDLIDRDLVAITAVSDVTAYAMGLNSSTMQTELMRVRFEDSGGSKAIVLDSYPLGTLGRFLQP